MPRVFLSYRRDDSPGHVGRLYDHLVRKFGNQKVFMDVEGIKPGADFERHLRFVLNTVDVFIAVIGPRWMGENEAGGPSRLEDPEDFVRLEIEGALQRKAFVVPVLVWDGSLPPPESLPASMRALTKYQSCRLS